MSNAHIRDDYELDLMPLFGLEKVILLGIISNGFGKVGHKLRGKVGVNLDSSQISLLNESQSLLENGPSFAIIRM